MLFLKIEDHLVLLRTATDFTGHEEYPTPVKCNILMQL